YVIEVSSYQLDLTTTFSPTVAILTNVSPDHLERHGGMEGYVAAKARIFTNAWVSLVGVDDSWGRDLASSLRAAGRTVGEVETSEHEHELHPRGPLHHEDHPRHWIPNGPVTAMGRKLVFDEIEMVDLTSARSLPGRHNAQNAAFAYLAARNLGIDHDAVVQGLLTFPGLAHRMEEVGRLGKVRFVNDSKATNADAARQALSSYERSFWIAGGRAKAGGIDDLEDLFPRVVEAFLIGEAAGPFAARLGDTPHRISGDMASAVKAAAEAAAATGREEVVLLSPAAASFDQYPDFEARGEAFRAAVLNLGATPSGHG
ncbi:MAG: UDP-N-acetylmuramoyl-L-alanine--D-glutamate ligase, partial [Alphaproteobacteria bacterium]|nr:UDP-N-acetylmuramoyl-L-alanine--D-glutamate ligase [Alphaproteobacteria bacterium]